MNKVFLILYYLLASKLPNYVFPGGKLYNGFRLLVLSRIIKLGIQNRIQRNVYLGNGKGITIGSNCRINENVRLDNVQIGNHVMIARDTVILGKEHVSKFNDIPMEQQGVEESRKTIIEDDVWIGLRSIILPGLKISTGTIIGAGAVVTKNTEPYGVYGGVPAKLIKYRKDVDSKL